MLTVVHVHVGSRLPRYLPDTLRQIRRFFDGRIVLLVAKRNLDNPSIRELNCRTVAYEPFFADDRIAAMQGRSFLRKYDKKGFWHSCLLRLFLLEVFMEEESLERVVHLENDVAIYSSPSQFEAYFHDLYAGKVAINPVGPAAAAAAYVYVDTPAALSLLNQHMMELLAKGEHFVESILGSNMVNEMILLKIVRDAHPDLVKYLPIMPHGEYSTCVDRFRSLFDCASWGQFVAGTPHGDKAGVAFPHHWVGEELLRGRYLVTWQHDALGRMCPFVQDRDGEHMLYPLNNLHIHSKRVRKYTVPSNFAFLNRRTFATVGPRTS